MSHLLAKEWPEPAQLSLASGLTGLQTKWSGFASEPATLCAVPLLTSNAMSPGQSSLPVELEAALTVVLRLFYSFLENSDLVMLACFHWEGNKQG